MKVYSGEIGIPYTEANRSLVGTSSLPLSEELDNLQWLHRGNVYGSGSGIGKFKYDFNYDGDTDDEGEQDYSQSSGSVTRFAQVDIFGGTIHRNVYGGGSQASVGPPPNGSYDAYRKGDTAEGHGPGKQSQTTVNISGTVGSPTGYNVVYGGEVYGASRGNIALPITFSTSVWTNVHIKNGAVAHHLLHLRLDECPHQERSRSQGQRLWRRRCRCSAEGHECRDRRRVKRPHYQLQRQQLQSLSTVAAVVVYE